MLIFVFIFRLESYEERVWVRFELFYKWRVRFDRCWGNGEVFFERGMNINRGREVEFFVFNKIDLFIMLIV